MELKETSCNSSAACSALLGQLQSMQYDRKIKIISGALSPNGYSVIEAQFKLKGTAEVWELSGLMDQHGGLTLRRIN